MTINENKQIKEFSAILEKFISFQTISTSTKYQDNVDDCLKWLAGLLKKNHIEYEIFKLTGSNPILFGEYIHNKELPTILIYGHYDVQPAFEKDGWKQNPFMLKVLNDKFIGRGVADNKGQLLIQLFSIFKLIKSGTLKYNFKFLIEGNEECGSAGLPEFIETHQDLLKSNLIIISDGEMSNNNPTIEVGFRGSANMTLKIQTANSHVHSGMYGNTIPNAIHEMIKILNPIFNSEDNISIPNFFELGSGEKLSINFKEVISTNEESLTLQLEQLSIKKYFIKNDYEFQLKSGFLPAFVITGFNAGYTDLGYSNIIPNTSEVKINLRFAPNQDSKRITDSVKKYFKKNIPDFIDYKLSIGSINDGTLIKTDNIYFSNAIRLLEEVFSEKIAYKFVGGSLPIINSFISYLKIPLLSIPLANTNCNMHGVNENLNIINTILCLEFCNKLYTSPL